jgi:hypothetical protein
VKDKKELMLKDASLYIKNSIENAFRRINYLIENFPLETVKKECGTQFKIQNVTDFKIEDMQYFYYCIYPKFREFEKTVFSLMTCLT